MKRSLLLLLTLCLLFSCACAQNPDERIHAQLSLPFEREVLFTFGEVTGSGKLHVTSEALNLGIRDGVLAQAAIHVSDSGVRVLFDGLDVTLSENSCLSLQTLRRAFSFLSEQRFLRADMRASEEDAALCEFVFSEGENHVRLAVTRKGYQVKSLSTEFGAAKISLRMQ